LCVDAVQCDHVRPNLARNRCGSSSNSRQLRRPVWPLYSAPFAPNETRSMPVEVPETIEVDTTRVSCEGIGGTPGHPGSYLEMGDENSVDGPYRARRFVLKPGAGHHH